MTDLVQKLKDLFLINLCLGLKINHLLAIEVTIVTEKSSELCDNVVDDQFVEALQKDSSKMLMQEIDVS